MKYLTVYTCSSELHIAHTANPVYETSVCNGYTPNVVVNIKDAVLLKDLTLSIKK